MQNDTLFNAEDTNQFIYSNRVIDINEKSIAGYVAKTGKAVVIHDAYAIGDEVPYAFNTSFDITSKYRTKSILAVPLATSRDKTVGVLQMINSLDENKEPISFSEEDNLYVSYFAHNAAVAIERAVMMREIILRMLRMSELRDPKETGAHVNRVGALSAEIYHRWAQNQGLSPERIKHEKDLIRLGAMMHDVGKVAISDLILKKPGKLTTQEYDIMKQHSIHGARLFQNTGSELDHISRAIALFHHERWDGKGYPGHIKDVYVDEIVMGKGYKGEETPIFGRITALADVYDALSSVRCYKDAWPQDRVYDELQRCSGTQFDPAVVEAFFSITDVIEAIMGKYTEEH